MLLGQRGLDGGSYVIGGEVKIDTSAGSNPEETIRKAQTIRAAALAPAEPSGARLCSSCPSDANGSPGAC